VGTIVSSGISGTEGFGGSMITGVSELDALSVGVMQKLLYGLCSSHDVHITLLIGNSWYEV